jgi:hypothetical protein
MRKEKPHVYTQGNVHYAKGKVKSSNVGQYATGGGGISTTE